MHVRNAGGADETEIILRSKKKYPIIVVQTNDNTRYYRSICNGK